MKRSAIAAMPQFFDRYINKVEDTDLTEGLKASLSLFDDKKAQLERVQHQRYAPGKWTPKDVLQHITDNERVQSYRALRIMRNDKTALPGYDQEPWAQHTQAAHLTIDELLHEFKIVRQASILMFKYSTDEMLSRTGTCSGVSISALALGFVLIGHQYHHLQILEEKYFTL